MDTGRLEQQLSFILEIDKLKSVLRRTYLLDRSRRENSAEHSWHLALMALILSDYANEPVDVGHVIKLVLVHDIVEIDAGDTYIYDTAGHADKADREQRAAERIFALLPAEQAAMMRALWDEFEAQETPEARFANTLDRMQPLLHNYHTDGAAWQESGISRSQVYERNERSARGSRALWQHMQAIIDDAVAKGYLKP